MTPSKSAMRRASRWARDSFSSADSRVFLTLICRLQRSAESHAALEAQIKEQAGRVRDLREAASGQGKVKKLRTAFFGETATHRTRGQAWRDDETTMEAVFELMRLKFLHPDFRHETLPDKADEVVLKVRWRVALADGSVVTLQRPFRNMPVVTGRQIHEAVVQLMEKKHADQTPVRQIRVVLDKANGTVADLELDRDYRLGIHFPGPKFELCRILLLECINDEWAAWEAGREERRARQEAKLKADAERKAQLLEAKKAAREAGNVEGRGRGNNNGKAKKKNGGGRGRGRGK